MTNYEASTHHHITIEREHVRSRLNLPEEFESTIPYTGCWSFRSTLSEEAKTILMNLDYNVSEDDSPLPYSDKVQEILQPWVKSNESALAFVEAALQKPVLYLPPVYYRHSDFQIPGWDRILLDSELFFTETLSYDFRMRSLYYLSLGNTEAAWHDVRQLYRFLELHQPNVRSFDSLSANYRLQCQANRAAESVLLSGQWNSEDVRRAYQEVIALQNPLTDADIQRILHGQRLILLSICQDVSRVIAVDTPLPACIFPFGQVMVSCNHTFNEQIKINKNSSRTRFNETYNVGVGDLFRYGLRNFWGFWIGMGRSHGWLDDIAECIDRKKTESELASLIFALELYRKENENRYPAALESLCSGYIEKMPVDPFSNAHEPMKYKVNADFTGYMVYSVGRDGVDNDGQFDDIGRKWNYGE